MYTLDTLAIGGAELSVLELIKNIKCFEVIVCVIYKANHTLLPEFEKLGVKIVFFGIDRRFGFYRASKFLFKLLKIENPDLVHATHFRTEVISRLIVPQFNIPLICSLISDTYCKERYNLISRRETVKLELYRILNRLTAYRANLFIAVSKAIVSPNTKYLAISEKIIKVIPNGRDISYYIQSRPFDRYKLWRDIPKDGKIIVSNSRVIRSKGFDEMIRAFIFLVEQKQDVYLLIVGDGRNASEYKTLINGKGLGQRICFLGTRFDIPHLLKACDIFWFASHYEGSPGAVIEGMLSKIPIVSSDIPAVTENLIDGKNAVLFRKGDWKDLAMKTEYLLQNWDMRHELVKNSYELATSKFDIRKIAKLHENLYLSII